MSHDNSTLKNSLIAITVLFVVGYGIFNSRFIIQGPEITLEALDEESNTIITEDKTLFLKGKVLHSSFISINGRPIFIDETGQFNEKLLLSNGVSIIDIYAKDKFGKEVRKKIDVLYQGNTPSVDYGTVALAATAYASTIESENATSTDSTSLVLTKAQIEVSDTETATTTDQSQEGAIMSTMVISTSTSSGF